MTAAMAVSWTLRTLVSWLVYANTPHTSPNGTHVEGDDEIGVIMIEMDEVWSRQVRDSRSVRMQWIRQERPRPTAIQSDEDARIDATCDDDIGILGVECKEAGLRVAAKPG
jgi:hypothetical protein